MIERLTAWRRSMFAQMALLTLIFLGWGIYVFAIRPMADRPVQAQVQPPLQATEIRLRGLLHQFMTTVRYEKVIPDLRADPLIREIAARNPGFRFYVRVGDRNFGNGQPVIFRRMRLNLLVRTQRSLADTAICSQATKIARQADGNAYADFAMCDTLTYFEYYGLRHPVVAAQLGKVALGEKRLWAFSSNFLIAAGGVFIIFALIFALHMLSIRRVARLTRSFDPQRLDVTLPEKGVATEILPLVRAVNHLIGQLDAAQRRATFFLSAAAHEMRTPLTVLRTRLELMEDGAQKDKLVGDVRRLMALVNQLLTLMSIGNRRDVTGFTDLVAAAHKVMRDLTPVAERKGVTLTFASDVATLEIPGDAALIGSAIRNLVDNAISFAPEGTAVALHLAADGVVTVRDHGPGIGALDSDTLFEPFMRPVSDRRGYGLGLAIVDAIVRLHGGRVAAANAVDGGAQFTVTFCSHG